MKLSLLFQLVTALVCLPAGAAALPAPAKAFLQKYCFECHDADTQKGKLRLDNLAADFTSPVNADIWGRVFAQLEKREMPPKKSRSRAMRSGRRCSTGSGRSSAPPWPRGSRPRGASSCGG